MSARHIKDTNLLYAQDWSTSIWSTPNWTEFVHRMTCLWRHIKQFPTPPPPSSEHEMCPVPSIEESPARKCPPHPNTWYDIWFLFLSLHDSLHNMLLHFSVSVGIWYPVVVYSCEGPVEVASNVSYFSCK